MKMRAGLLQIHLAVLLFGFSGLFGKFLALSPATITFGRTVFGAVAIFVVARIVGTSLRLGSRPEALRLLVCGALLAAHWFTFFKSIQVSSVAIGLLSYSSFPLFTTFLEPLFFRERLRAVDAAVAGLVATGLLLIPHGFTPGDHVVQGMLWGVLSGFAFALLSLLNRSLARTGKPLTIAFYQNAFAAICLAPAAVWIHDTLSPPALLQLVALGVVFTGGAHLLFIGSLRHIRAGLASVIACLEPIYGILFALVLLGETPSMRTLLGGAFILSAVFAAMRLSASSSGSAGETSKSNL